MINLIFQMVLGPGANLRQNKSRVWAERTADVLTLLPNNVYTVPAIF